MIKRIIPIILLFISFNIQAQEGTSSPYSFYGIGSLKFKGTTENRAMGGVSIYTDSIHMNFRNPASYAGKNMFSFNNEGRLVKFTVGVGHTETKLETSESSDNASTTTFDYLGLNIPMGKFGMGFGVIPYSSVGYKLETRNINDSLQYKYSGNGGVNKVFLGFGYQISDNLSIGLDAHYNFGNVQNSALEFLYDDEQLPLDYQAREINRSDLSGINYNLGISYKPMINEKTQLITSFTYSPEYNLASKNKRTFASVIINPTTNIEFPINEIEVDLLSMGLEETDLKMPSKMSVGLGIGSIRNWFIGSEYSIIKSSVFSSDLLNIENTYFEDSSVLSIGGFYIPDYNSFNKLLQRIVYRSGIYFEKTGLNINNQSIKEFGITFGLGIPVSRLFSNLNTVIEIGKRGTTDSNLVEENFINFQLSLSLNDRWFVKRKYN
ncbi:MAG: hypothetical protein VX573_00480 [Bacteroidota bacterium]|nr:hypothetical protein [Bacteroidota bacterium]